MKPEKAKPEYSFSSFLLTQEPQFRDCLNGLHQLIKSIVPDAEEMFSYQVHCFKHIYMLVGIGATKEYCSLYTMSSKLVKQIKNELSGCKLSGMTLHFNPDEPLPVEIITRIVLARVQENEMRATTRREK
ncbi:iron chaperone [Mucilaginibacter sp. McL0603]|uniref:iron chaperone n=1 Tax=Mucilaginibacter sp. McL0603 TaxID=3415670 RepID=UPI003CE79D35